MPPFGDARTEVVQETPPALASRFCLLTAGFTLPIAVAAPQASVTRTYRSHGERNSLQITRLFCEVSPRSTGLGSVEGASPTTAHPQAQSSPRSTGLGSVEGSRSATSQTLMGWSPRSTGLGSVEGQHMQHILTLTHRHPGLRAWAPLKGKVRGLHARAGRVTQVYGPGLR